VAKASKKVVQTVGGKNNREVVKTEKVEKKFALQVGKEYVTENGYERCRVVYEMKGVSARSPKRFAVVVCGLNAATDRNAFVTYYDVNGRQFNKLLGTNLVKLYKKPKAT
jgi:hypothetical protein